MSQHPNRCELSIAIELNNNTHLSRSWVDFETFQLPYQFAIHFSGLEWHIMQNSTKFHTIDAQTKEFMSMKLIQRKNLSRSINCFFFVDHPKTRFDIIDKPYEKKNIEFKFEIWPLDLKKKTHTHQIVDCYHRLTKLESHRIIWWCCFCFCCFFYLVFVVI